MHDNDNETTTETTAAETPTPPTPRPATTAIVKAPIRFGSDGVKLQTWDDAQRVATAFAASRYFDKVHDAAQALVKITMGAELGFSPMASMLGIYIIEGRPAMSSAMINATIRKSGRYRFEVQRWDEEACALLWRERVDGEWLVLGPSSFTIADAQRAGLAGKGVWKSYPKAMLWSRALTQGARAYAADLFFGGAPIYTPDELDETMTVDGSTGAVLPPQVQHEQRGVAGVTAAIAAQAMETNASNAREVKAARATVSKAKAKAEPQDADVVPPSAPVSEPGRTTTKQPQPAPSASTSPPSPPEASSTSASEPAVASSPTPSESGASADAAFDALLGDSTAPPLSPPPAFAEAVVALGDIGDVTANSSAMTAIVVKASALLDAEHKQALRMFTRALFNKSKGLDPLAGIASAKDREALALALAVDGNTIGDESLLASA